MSQFYKGLLIRLPLEAASPPGCDEPTSLSTFSLITKRIGLYLHPVE